MKNHGKHVIFLHKKALSIYLRNSLNLEKIAGNQPQNLLGKASPKPKKPAFLDAFFSSFFLATAILNVNYLLPTSESGRLVLASQNERHP
jgi:hypothetical protein